MVVFVLPKMSRLNPKMSNFDDNESVEEEQGVHLLDDGYRNVKHADGEPFTSNARSTNFYSKSKFVGFIATAAIAIFWLGFETHPILNTSQSMRSDGIVEVTQAEEPVSAMSNSNPETLQQLRFDLASLSIDMMQSDMATDAAASKFVDIGPLCDLIESALEEIGFRGVIRELLNTELYIDVFAAAAEAKGIHDLSAKIIKHEGAFPAVR
jgi:hypothetical protein